MCLSSSTSSISYKTMSQTSRDITGKHPHHLDSFSTYLRFLIFLKIPHFLTHHTHTHTPSPNHNQSRARPKEMRDCSPENPLQHLEIIIFPQAPARFLLYLYEQREALLCSFLPSSLAGFVLGDTVLPFVML